MPLGIVVAALSVAAIFRVPRIEVIAFWALVLVLLVVLLVMATGAARVVIVACLLFVALVLPFGVWWGRISLIEAPASTEVSALFPDDVIEWDTPDDHGWWDYTMHYNSDRDPQELCEAIHAAMVERFPYAIPGTGIVISEKAISGNPAGTRAYCGMPAWWGHPQSAHSWDISHPDTRRDAGS